jgi:outer membrane autotransporter protein
MDTDYSSSGFQTGSGNEVDFDSSSAYYGAHAGLGYIWHISEASSLDLYTKYLWTHQDSDPVTIEGDSIRFKAVDSHRWRTGARFAHSVDTEKGLRFTPYVGAAYEQEFGSKARAAANGNSIDSPDVKGGTGIGELGFSFKSSAISGFSMDLGVQGYIGKREGVSGSFQVKFEF